MTGKRVRSAGILLILILVCLSGCVSPQTGSSGGTGQSGGPGQAGTSGSTGGGTGPGATQTQAPVVTGFLTPATPFPTVTTPVETMPWTRLPNETAEVVRFVTLHHATTAFRNNATAFSYDLTQPPLIIEFCFSPNMTTRTIWYETNVGTRKEHTETITTVSPSAWFEVTVRDPATGNIVAKEGFARQFSVDTTKSIVIRRGGNYLIEFAGNEISAEIRIIVPETETQTGAPLQKLSCRP